MSKRAFKPGDRVQAADGTRGIVVEPLNVEERAEGGGRVTMGEEARQLSTTLVLVGSEVRRFLEDDLETVEDQRAEFYVER